jgi:hypothetical protein
MSSREAREPSHALVEARVVLHRARAEWIEAEVDGRIPGRQASEVAYDLDLGDFRKPLQLRAKELGVEILGRVGYASVGERVPHARRTAQLEEQRLLVAEARAGVRTCGPRVAH